MTQSLKEQIARHCDPELWAKIDKYRDDDDWHGATASQAAGQSLKRAEGAIEIVAAFLDRKAIAEHAEDNSWGGPRVGPKHTLAQSYTVVAGELRSAKS